MSGSLWLKPPGPGAGTLPAVPRPRGAPAGAPAADPMEELAGRLGTFVSAAVHPDEIAAVLESDGMTDEHIRLAYGREDSFTLAEDLYARVPRAFPEPAAPADPWRVSLLACLLRGVIFVLPGLAYLLGGPLLEGPPDRLGLPAGTVTLLAGALIGWVWDQTLSHRAYSWLGLGDRAAAGRTLLVGAPAGALLGAAAACAVPGGPAFSYAFAAGQAVYVGAATVLLVLGRERLLLFALAPMAAGAAASLAVDLPAALRILLLLLSLLGACALAVRELPVAAGVRAVRSALRRPLARRPGEGQVRWRVLRGTEDDFTPRGPRLADSVPFGLFGLGTGLLVLYAALGEVLAGAAPTAVALTLSMGPAEWLLHRFRSGSLTGLRAARSPGAFRRTMLATLARCLAAYLGVVLVLGVVGTLLWPGAPQVTASRVAILLLLATVMWSGLLLQSFGAIRIAAAVVAGAALIQAAVVLFGLAPARTAQLAVAATTAVALSSLACVLLGRATSHR
ncbi:hypothetical protein [Streptomyces sp. NPDC089799]|uniref:hypothetical protein n=1 Tax=Streptomyces sp. NPDC089799 TaxID=3155066 RepID=UPI003433620B